MADPKKDASTDIEKKVKAFAKDMTAEAAKLRKARLATLEKAAAKKKDDAKGGAKGKGDDKKKKDAKGGEAKVPEVTFALSKTKVSKSRTPAEQAKLVVAGSTKVCWSSHMADKARHVLMKVDGKVSWDAKAAFGDDFDAFKKKWAAVMKKHGLKNASGKDGWPTWDEFHLELPNSKVKRSDERSKSCLEEYARLTRQDGKKKNTSFEKKYAKLLKTYIEKFEKEAAKKGGAKAGAK